MGAFKTLAAGEYSSKRDKTVCDELQFAEIPVLKLDAYLSGEVKTHYIGLLNGFVFTRGWRYWCCTGDMPLAHAKVIYEGLHHLAVRAEGHADNIEPIGYSPIQREEERKAMDALVSQNASGTDIVAKLKDISIDHNPALPRFVEVYHIDTTEGLAALAQYIKENDIYACNGEEGSYTWSVFPENRK